MADVDSLDEISKFIFTSKYARYDETLNRRETWDETVDRVQNMHIKHFRSLPKEDKDKIKWAFNFVREKRVVPSMRSMQFGGKAVEAHNARIFNCAVRHVDSLRSFAEIFYLLLCGNGVGIGLSNQFLGRLPDLVTANDKTGTVVTYVIEDTIEGWSDSLEALLMCYFRNTPYTGRKIVFDYSRIRPEGAALKTGGGKAPGYKGLKACHKKVKTLLDFIIEEKEAKRLKTIYAYDVLMHAADAVLSGGIRRSATAIIFDKTDDEMMEAKTVKKVDRVFSFHFSHEKKKAGVTVKIFEGLVKFEGEKKEIQVEEWELEDLQKKHLVNWWHLFPQRARSNNSVLLLRNETTKEDFVKIIERTKQFGEPGFVFANHPWQLFNPCFEIGFIPVTDDGVCGVQFCNLTSINGAKVDSQESFLDTVEAATIIGTLQAAYTKFPYLHPTSQKLTEEESLLGVSITGVMDNPHILLDEKIQNKGADYAKEVNKSWAKKLGIRQASRVTCVKPEGTSSLVLGSGSGIHAHHARRYFRRVQCNRTENPYQHFKSINPHACEESVWSANKTDDVVTFPIQISDKAMVKSDLYALKHLQIIRDTQINWVTRGTSDSNTKPITHNVSCTVIVSHGEWDAVIDYLFDNKDHFAAVSLLPKSGDKDYPQAPNEAIISAEDNQKWNELVENFKSVDYSELREDEDLTHHMQEAACSGGKCDI
jgi:ribonucleoside-triphosphate reductase